MPLQPAPCNLFQDLPDHPSDEVVQVLLEQAGTRIERIVSRGQASPPGFWYDQDQAEWVLLLQGSALLRFQDEAQPRVLGPGDALHIAAHRLHRVEATAAEGVTLWLAVFLPAAAEQA